MWLFDPVDVGLSNAFRIGHVIVAVMWMGLLWFFNFVQVPSFAEMDAGARNNALDKLTWRALWWFRWAAVATLVFGLLIIFALPDRYMEADFWKTPSGMVLALGIIMAVVMAANVWMIIWPKQQIVIGNARNVQAGGEANPEAAAKGRLALMASRQNTIFSLPMLIFMVGTAHFPYNQILPPEGSKRALYWGITIVVWAAFELKALGIIGGTKPGGLNAIYDTHKNTLITGFVLSAVWLGVYALVLAN
jgi:Urate oxidase N-terminal